MAPIDVLQIGQKYSKKDLSTLINEPRLLTVREGVESCVNSNAYLLFAWSFFSLYALVTHPLFVNAQMGLSYYTNYLEHYLWRNLV